jgi:hypothetical protein
MPNYTLYPDIHFYSSSGILFTPTAASIDSGSGYRLEAFDNGTLNIYKKNSGSVSSEYLLNISSSNREPRIGFGFEPNQKFEKTFEIKSSKDSQFGTEFVLKSSRLDKGGEIGDYAGIIDFVVESGSYEKVNISGSIADIKAEITNITNEGAAGDIIFSTAYNPKIAPAEVLRINGVTSNFSSSLRVMGDNLTIDTNLISEGITQLNGNTITTLITASGDISSSGNVYGANLIGNVIGTTFFPVGGTPETNEVTFYHSSPTTVLGNSILQETSSVDFKFFRQGEGGYTNSSTLELTGSLIITGSAIITGPLTITGSQLITDDITSGGTIRARVKSFDIPHPTRKGKRLVYGALEGPEHGIYCRGESKELQVLLPPEWRAMVDKKGISVQITPIGEWQPLYFKKFHSNWIHFGCGDDRENVHFFWEIKGERTDVPSLETVQ